MSLAAEKNVKELTELFCVSFFFIKNKPKGL